MTVTPMLRIAVGVLTIGTVLALLGYRWWSGPPETEVEAMARQGAQAFSSLPVTPFTSEQAIADALRHNADIQFQAGQPELSPHQAQLLFESAARFLWLYYGETSIEPYLTWRQATGFRLIPQQEMIELFGANEGYQFYYGRDIPPGLSDEQLYEAIWTANRTCCNNKNHAVAVAADKRAVVVRSLWNPTGELQAIDAIEGAFSADIWQGARIICCRTWWQPQQPLTLHTRGVLEAVLAIVLEFKDGSRRPMLLQWHWNNAASNWRLIAVSVMNTADRDVLGPEF